MPRNVCCHFCHMHGAPRAPFLFQAEARLRCTAALLRLMSLGNVRSDIKVAAPAANDKVTRARRNSCDDSGNSGIGPALWRLYDFHQLASVRRTPVGAERCLERKDAATGISLRRSGESGAGASHTRMEPKCARYAALPFSRTVWTMRGATAIRQSSRK
jgi:hypothetical protein